MKTGPSPDAHELPGAKDLVAWYESFPGFHDADVEQLQINGDGTEVLKVKAHRMTDRVDSDGYFVLEKQFIGTFSFSGISAINLTEFMKGCIIFSLDIRRLADGFEIDIHSSYGFGGIIRAQNIEITFEPQVSE